MSGVSPIAYYRYDAWGNCKVLNPNGTENTSATFVGNINPIRYRSYYYDTDIGLYYLQTRYYDPETGRFINLDQIEYLSPEQLNGLNLYAYCLNNPVMNIDPIGTSWLIALAILAIMLFTPIGGTAVQTAVSVASYVGMTVASIWDEEIRENMTAIHWNPFNSDESAVLSSSKVSFYKGVPVYLISDMGGSMSLGAIFFDKSQGGEVLKHERGHNTQLMCMGLGNYLFQIGIPSMWKNNVNNPWELSASMLGGSALANSSTATQKTNAVNYFILSSIVGLNISTIMWYLLV